LDKKFGGDCDFEYVHAAYWPEFIRIASERRAAYTAKWVELGSQIGASETDLKGTSSHDQVSEAAAAVEKLEVN
jgi:hypothetical protein